MVMQMKTHSIIEHERQVAVWYRACPEVTGIDPEIFIAWPVKLSYELELGDVSIERLGDVAQGPHRKAIHPDEPSVPCDFLDYLRPVRCSHLRTSRGLVNHEIQKSSLLARYLHGVLPCSAMSLCAASSPQRSKVW